MSIIEQIRAEVERQKGYYRITNPYDKRAIRVCEKLLSFLSTLQEQPVCDGLEEEIVKVCEDFVFPLYGLDDEFGRELINKIARHFAQWQKEKDEAEITFAYADGCTYTMDRLRREAVEGVVSLQFADGTGAVRTTDGFLLNGLRCGDKVRIIIVKEEGK